ncbi:hypothetical protein QN277_005087 [Acacia crassicarpa]|uniref:BURP domain-containing protein n=1 Tax=Acacia crassicarpa TaxID=499986 RepID=A0AAE1IWB5_9FABA|nr:hypothetical protein QN277_005087 [Acacia crassicarpa]
MRLGLACWSFLLCALLLFMIAYDGGPRKITITFGRDIELKKVSTHMQNLETDGHILHKITQSKTEEDEEEEEHEKINHNHMDPELNVFFTPKDLKIGNKMPIYFAHENISASPKFLPREESEKIPFSSRHLPSLLKFFSFPKHSPQAKAMKYTLKHCEFKAMEGETKFCATSLESLLDSTRKIFGPSEFSMLSTTYLTKSPVSLQNYTISKVKNISVSRVIGCHPLPYPYAVFYCHSQENDTRLFVVMLEGEQDGARVKAPAICHMDTSMWNKDHVAFDVLKVQPGTSPVCHFFPPDNLIWVPLSSVL